MPYIYFQIWMQLFPERREYVRHTIRIERQEMRQVRDGHLMKFHGKKSLITPINFSGNKIRRLMLNNFLQHGVQRQMSVKLLKGWSKCGCLFFHGV